MVPCCEKCHKEMVLKNSEWVKQCRCKDAKTPKAPQNRMTRNQKNAFKSGKFDFDKMAFHERPEYAQIQ